MMATIKSFIERVVDNTYTRDNIMFLELERIDASTMEKYKYFNLDSLKALFKKWKESKLPQQMSLF